MNQLLLLGVVKLLSNFRRLDDIVGNLFGSRVRNSRALGKSVKYLELAILFDLLLIDQINEVSNVVYVVTKEHTSTERDYNNEESLDVIARMKISKANSQDDRCPKVITPNVLLPPRSFSYIISHHPALLWFNLSDSNQSTG